MGGWYLTPPPLVRAKLAQTPIGAQVKHQWYVIGTGSGLAHTSQVIQHFQIEDLFKIVLLA